MRLIVVVWVDGVHDTVLDELLQGGPLADELDELGDAAAAAQHNQLFLFEKQLLDGAAFFLVKQLVDLYVASIENKTQIE